MDDGISKPYVALNPTKYTVRGGEIGFVIALSSEKARDIATYSEKKPDSQQSIPLQEVFINSKSSSTADLTLFSGYGKLRMQFVLISE
jgi:hypothetical protein